MLQEDGLEFREEVVFPDGTVYKGQLKDGQRHGYGIQVWPDGARYEGLWRNNVASGRGRFFHTDGDVYDGKTLEPSILIMIIEFFCSSIELNDYFRRVGKR